MRKQGPGFALPVLGFAHGREGRRSDQGQSSHGGKDLWPADGGGTGAGAGRRDGPGSLVPLHLPVRGRDHHPGHQPAPGDHPELRLPAHPRTDDLTGQRFGRLTVLALTEARGSNGGAVWQCQCDCGKMVQVHAHKLKCGHTRSCGCAHQDGIRNLQGQRFGKRTVLEDSGQRRAGGGILWRCRCQCGQEKLIRQDALVAGRTRSCGCITSRGNEKIARMLTQGGIAFAAPLGICQGATASTLRCSARGSWPTSLRTTGFSIPPTAAGAGTRKPGFSAPRPAMG